MKKLSLLLVFSFAFLFSITAQKNQETTSNVGTSDGKNWFIGAGVQGDVYVNDNATRDADVWTTPSLAGNLFVGKWLSHKVGLRLFGEGGSYHPFFNDMKTMVHEKYLLGRVDFMLNFTNLFRSFSEDRFYNLIPYVGVGGEHTFNAIHRPDGADGSSTFIAGGGLLNTFRLSHNWAAFINLGLNVGDAKSDGFKGDNPSFFGRPNYFDGVVSGSVGLIYNFGGAAKKEVVPPPVVVQEAPKYTLTVVNGRGSGSYEAGTVVNISANCSSSQTFDRWSGDVNGVANVNSANTTIKTGSSSATVTAVCKDLPHEQPKVVEPVKATINPVFFRLDKSIVDPDQQVNIQTAADYMKANPSAKLHVVGYADVQTGNPKYNLGLSERRTRAVAKALVSKYKIDSSRLILDWKGDTVQPFSVSTVLKNKETKETTGSNEKNRVVMFVE